MLSEGCLPPTGCVDAAVSLGMLNRLIVELRLKTMNQCSADALNAVALAHAREDHPPRKCLSLKQQAKYRDLAICFHAVR